MVQRLSDSNAVKVNLMLGMKSKVEDIITSEYYSSNSAFYFICAAKDYNIIPDLPEDLRHLRPEIYKHCTNDKNELILQNYYGDLIFTLFTIPIKKKGGKLLGFAGVLYDISKDIGFWSSFGADLDECLFIIGDDNIVDLRSHQTTAIPTKLLNLDPEEFESNLSNIFPDSLCPFGKREQAKNF